MGYYLGIDVGTSALKVLLVHKKDGRIVAEKTKGYRTSTPQAGWVEQNPDDWVEALRSSLFALYQEQEALFKAVTAVSITGQMHGIVPTGHDGQALHPALIWSDQRNREELMELQNLLTTEEWAKKTGNRPNISFSLGKIRWLEKNKPELASRVHAYLFPKDYLRLKLTGVLATDFTDASASNMLDMQERVWSEEILDACSMDKAKLPQIVESASIAGYITEEAGRYFHLQKGIPVVCGCGDAQAQAVGNGLLSDTAWQVNIGTSGQVMAGTDRPEPEASGRLHLYVHAAKKKWFLVGATLSAGMSLQWLAENVYQNETSVPDLLEAASQARRGSGELLFLPYLFGERTPHMDEKAKGAFIGLTNSHTKAEMSRAVLEGVLFSLYQSYRLIAEVKGKEPAMLLVSGGASQHDLWMQTAASIFNKRTTTKANRGGAAYGAAMIAAVGSGDYSDVEEVMTRWKVREHEKEYRPDEEAHRYYQRLFYIFEKSYASLKERNHELDELREGE